MNLHQNCAASKAKIVNNAFRVSANTSTSRRLKRPAVLAPIPFWTIETAIVQLQKSRNSSCGKASAAVLLSMLNRLRSCGASMYYSSHFLQKKFLLQASEVRQVLTLLQSLGGGQGRASLSRKPRRLNIGIAASEYIIKVESSEMFVAVGESGLMGRVLLA